MKKCFKLSSAALIGIILALSAPAYANINPQKEGIVPWMAAILIGYFAIGAAGIGRMTFPELLIYGLLFIGTAGMGWTVGCMPFICGVVLVVLLGQSLVKKSLNPLQVIIAVTLMALSMLGFLVADESRSYYGFGRNHDDVMKAMQADSKKLEEFKAKDLRSLYPSLQEFTSTWQCTNQNLGKIVYSVSDDRKSYTLRFEGDYFSKSIWFRLPPGYPQYSSASGWDPGKRENPYSVYWSLWFNRMK